MSQQDFAEVINTEHISDRDGENINAKRIGLYGYDYSAGLWRRLAANASGSILGGVTSITGTANQITASAATGAVTLSLPIDVIIDSPNLITTTTQGLGLRNATASTAGVPVQYSPAFDLIGHGWKTGLGAADQTVRFRNELRPVNGAPATGNLVWSSSVDTGTASWTDRMTLTSAGALTITGAFQATGATLTGRTISQVLYTASGGAITSNANLTYDGSVFNVNNAEFRTVVNTSVIPASNAGLSVIWNYTSGSAEVDLFNIFEGAGNSFHFYQKINSTTAELLVRMTRYFTKFTNTSTDVNAGVQPVNVEAVHDVSSNTSQRSWGLNFNAKARGVGNFTDATAGLTGFEGISDYNGTGTMTRQIGGLVYFANTNTGTITEGIGLYAYPLLNNGGGTVTTAVNLQVGDNLAVTANSQVRVGLKFQAGIPGTGGFSTTKRAQQWFAYDSTDAANGIWWGASLDTGMYRGASAQLNLTGSLVASATVTGTTIYASGDAGGVASTNSVTNATDSNSLATGATILRRNSGTNAGNQSWIKIYVGTTARYIPVWD